MIEINRRRFNQLASALPLLAAAPAMAQSAWPTKPVRLVLQFPPDRKSVV